MSAKTFVAPNIPIKSVLCFQNRAEIRREFEVFLEKGFNTVIVEHLPAFLIPNSIRVDGEASNRHATLRDVQYKESFSPAEENYSDELRALIKNLDDLKESKAQLKDEETVLETSSKAMEKLVENLVCQKPQEMILVNDDVVNSYDKTFRYYRNKQVRLKSESRAVQVDIKALEKKIFNLQGHVNELKDKDNNKRSVHITLDADESTNFTLKLQYEVNNASWEAFYDVRVDTKARKLSLQYLASIRQMTGEDWNDILVSLSTNEPEDAGQLPELHPLIAKFASCQVKGYFEGYGSESLKKDVLRGLKVMKSHDVAVRKNIVATTYDIPLKRTILSRDDETKVPIAVKTLDYEVERQVVPSKSKTVFLVASVLNSTEFHLIEGTAKIYVDSAYANALQLREISPNEWFSIALGKDPNVKVEYKPKDSFQQQSGMIQKSNVTAYEQKIVVKNNNQEKVVVTVFDQVPKSNDERIKIKLVLPEVKRDEKKSHKQKHEVGTILTEQNTLEWTVEVPAGGESELDIKYNVEYPQNESVIYQEQY